MRCWFGHAFVEAFREHHPLSDDGWGQYGGYTDVYEECRRCGVRELRFVRDLPQDDKSRWLRGES